MPMRIKPVPRSKSVSGSGAGLKLDSAAMADDEAVSRMCGGKSMAGFSQLGTVEDKASTEFAGVTKRPTPGSGEERASIESPLAGEELPRTTKRMIRPRRHTHARSLSEPCILTFPRTTPLEPRAPHHEYAIGLPNGRRIGKRRFAKDCANPLRGEKCDYGNFLTRMEEQPMKWTKFLPIAQFNFRCIRFD